MNRKVAVAARIVLGLIFVIFGLNAFLQFMPAPPPMPEGAMAYLNGIMAAPYFFPVLKITEITCGILLLTGIAAPLALVILAPITLQIFLFHAFLTPGLENLLVPVVMVIVHFLAASAFWHLYRPLFNRVSFK